MWSVVPAGFALLRRLAGDGRDKDIEILSLRHQVAVLQRQLAGQQVRFEPVDRAWLAALRSPAPGPFRRRYRGRPPKMSVPGATFWTV